MARIGKISLPNTIALLQGSKSESCLLVIYVDLLNFTILSGKKLDLFTFHEIIGQILLIANLFEKTIFFKLNEEELILTVDHVYSNILFRIILF